ncbi:MAG: amidophosphoribosyltransferase [Bacteroidales bacterium]
MSDSIKHECGVAMIRLRKPLSYYHQKYGTWRYGLNKLYLLMEKQHNRGQDGAGVAALKLDQEVGEEYLNRVRSASDQSIKDVFNEINASCGVENGRNADDAKKNLPFIGEIYLGHLRYGTFGKNNIKYCHPMWRKNNWRARNLAIAGNFNLTNISELYKHLITRGQHPLSYTDTETVMEMLAYYLDKENDMAVRTLSQQGKTPVEITSEIENNLNVESVLKNATEKWDGGYVMGGILGHGDIFVARDPWGIRPAFYYIDDEIVVVASERPVIQTTFNVPVEKIMEIPPGEALIVKRNNDLSFVKIREKKQVKQCSFERIYFSRGSDTDIYKERKELGRQLRTPVLKSINNDFTHSVFSYIPNTAETAFYGLIEGLNEELTHYQQEKLASNTPLSKDKIKDLLSLKVRTEKIAIKDAKLRTFISDDASRDDLVSHVYDVTYGTLKKDIDNLVIIDDSIVRGTTLKKSILSILSRLSPKKITVLSSAPQIRYPDCYGIDMSQIHKFIAFEAAIALLKDTKQEHIVEDVYNNCLKQLDLQDEEMINAVKNIYEPFSAEQVSAKIAELLKPQTLDAELEIIYQNIEGLHKACPNHKGDWYFTGNYPTPGGNRVVNRAFVNFCEKNDERAY